MQLQEIVLDKLRVRPSPRSCTCGCSCQSSYKILTMFYFACHRFFLPPLSFLHSRKIIRNFHSKGRV
ncbi:Plant defensin [Parasponia andersonii]|uniref:Plant defensin n=1 Tax=Parasponia andersonii TaxID=3476 RepID=A0A2P5C1L5_PARAD|nr:Plant defensin [Parasponia andersonii]